MLVVIKKDLLWFPKWLYEQDGRFRSNDWRDESWGISWKQTVTAPTWHSVFHWPQDLSSNWKSSFTDGWRTDASHDNPECPDWCCLNTAVRVVCWDRKLLVECWIADAVWTWVTDFLLESLHRNRISLAVYWLMTLNRLLNRYKPMKTFYRCSQIAL